MFIGIISVDSVCFGFVVVICSIKNDAHLLEALVAVDSIDIGNHLAVKQTCADNEDSAIHIFLHNLGIYNDIRRRTVNEDIIIVLASLFEELSDASIVKEFGGVRRTMTDRHHKHSVMACHRHNKLTPVIGIAGQIAADTLAGMLTNCDTEPWRKSPSTTSTFLPFNANDEARLKEMNDLPEPGLNDVTIMTLQPF